MASTKVAINGMGRIGRSILREWALSDVSEFEVVAVNNPGNPQDYCHLIEFDSLHGRFPHNVSLNDNILTLGRHKLTFFGEKDPQNIDWPSLQVDIVIDASGRFKDQQSLSKHLRGSVKKVVMCAPGKDLDATFVYGINHETYRAEQHHIVSNASCTTNCLAPVAKTLHDIFGIENGIMTTVHSYTGDQEILDSAHKDPRRARAACLSMIPTTTGAAKAVGQVIPELNGKLDGLAVRVPTPDVSLVDLTVVLKKTVTKDEVNEALKKASQSYLKSILGYEERPLVSVDFMGTRESSIVDASLTNVIDRTVKVISWYDNEVGFSNRVIDLARYMAERL